MPVCTEQVFFKPFFPSHLNLWWNGSADPWVWLYSGPLRHVGTNNWLYFLPGNILISQPTWLLKELSVSVLLWYAATNWWFGALPNSSTPSFPSALLNKGSARVLMFSTTLHLVTTGTACAPPRKTFKTKCWGRVAKPKLPNKMHFYTDQIAEDQIIFTDLFLFSAAFAVFKKAVPPEHYRKESEIQNPEITSVNKYSFTVTVYSLPLPSGPYQFLSLLPPQ